MGFIWEILGKVDVVYQGLKLGMPAQIPCGIQLENTGHTGWCVLPWAQQTWSEFSPTTVPDNNRQSGLSPITVPEMSTGGETGHAHTGPVRDFHMVYRAGPLALAMDISVWGLYMIEARGLWGPVRD